MPPASSRVATTLWSVTAGTIQSLPTTDVVPALHPIVWTRRSSSTGWS